MNQEKILEIDLVVVFKSVWARKKIVVAITFFSIVLSVGISYLIKPTFRAEVVLAPVTSELSDSKNNVANQLGGLASLAGIGSGGVADESTINLAKFKSRKFVREFIQENNLLPILYEEDWDDIKKVWIGDDVTLWEAVNYFELNIRNISTNLETGLITLTIDWYDPEVAVIWAENMVVKINKILYSEYLDETERNLDYLNDQLQKTQNSEMRALLYNLIQEQIKKAMLANDTENFAYKTVDPAVIPDLRISPKRSLFAIAGMLLGGVIGIAFAWILEHKKSKIDQ